MCIRDSCNTVHRKDKWIDHCKKKHAYKFKNNLKINYKVIEIKTGDGPWKKYEESTESGNTASHQLGEETGEESR